MPAEGEDAGLPDLAARLRPGGGRNAGGSDGGALALALLLRRFLRYDAADPAWPDRDRLILAGSTGRYAGQLAHIAGAPALPVCLPATYALGFGLGACLAERLLAQRFGRSLVDHRSWVLADSETLLCGSGREAAHLAGHWQADRLIVLAEGDGWAEAASLYAELGWAVRRVEEGDLDEEGAAAGLARLITKALRARRPSLIFCPPWPPGADDGARAPAPSRLAPWGRGGSRAAARRGWLKRLARSPQRASFLAAAAGAPMAEIASLPAISQTQAGSAAAAMTLWLSLALERSAELVTNLVQPQDGPAHAAPATGHMAPQVGAAPPPPRTGRLINADRQPQGGAAAFGGMAWHGGMAPVLRLRPAEAETLMPFFRLAASRQLHLVCVVMAEGDAPADPAIWRAIAGLAVMEPADPAEAEECLILAIRHAQGPTILLPAVGEAALPPLPRRGACAAGAYLRLAPQGMGMLIAASGAAQEDAARACERAQVGGMAVGILALPCPGMAASRRAAEIFGEIGAPRVLHIQRTGSTGGFAGALPGAQALPIPLQANASEAAALIDAALAAPA